MKGWIKKRFSVSRGKGNAAEKDPSEKRRSFFGGGSHKAKASNASNTSLENRSSSIRDVALAGKDGAEEASTKEPAIDAAIANVVEKGDEADKAPELEVREPEAEEATASAATAGKTAVADTETSAGKTEEKADSRGVSPVSTPFEDADERSRTLEPPKPLEGEGRRSSSIARDSRFKEEM